MNKSIKKLILLFFVFSLMLSCSCAQKMDDDAMAVAGYLKYFDNPEEVVFTKIDKYVFEDRTLYNVAWIDNSETENEVIDLLLDYNQTTTEVRLCFWRDMKYSSKAAVKKLWDEREEKALSHVSYNEQQISDITKRAAEYARLAYSEYFE